MLDRKRPRPKKSALALRGRTLHVGSDAPFVIQGELAWYVVAGRVDVFAVPLDGNQVAGARKHLFRAGVGQVLVGLPHESNHLRIGLLGVGRSGTKLRALTRADLHEVATDPSEKNRLGALLDEWIDALCMSLTGGTAPEDCLELESGTHTVAADSLLRPRKNVLWIRHEMGRSQLLGNDDLVINGCGTIPLSRGAWIQPKDLSRIKLTDTPDIVGTDEMWRGLDQLHTLTLQCAEELREADLARDRRRMDERARSKGQALSTAFGILATTLSISADKTGADAAPDGIRKDPGDVLLDAFQMVGLAAHLNITAPPSRSDGPPNDLASIARASRVRTRSVLLRGEWWRADGGPLLGRLRESGRPIALIPDSPSDYIAHDPVNGTSQRVTEEVARSIDPRAHLLYRPFPERKLGLRDVVSFGLSRSHRDVVTVAGMTVAAGLLSLVTPLATAKIFNDIIPGADRSALLQLVLGLLLISVAIAAFNLLRAVALIRIEGKMGEATQSAVWDRLLALPPPFFRGFEAGELASRAMGIDGIRQILSGATVRALMGGGMALIQYALLFYFNTTLALWASLLLAIAILAAAVAGRFRMRDERRVAALRNRITGRVLQFLSSISKLKSGGAEPQAFAIWARRFSEQRRVQFKVRTIANALMAFNVGYPTLSIAVLYAVALPIVAEGIELRTGDFLAFMSAYATCLAGVLGATTGAITALAVVPLYEQAKPVLESVPEVHLGKANPGQLKGGIEIQHLRFRYQTDSPPVIRDISLELEPGEYVAFVGPSGSGKSTLLRLLLGFESPESGAVYYDGHDLEGIDAQAVRSQIGVVLQDSRLMSGDIFNNIAGSSGASIDQVWDAAEAAGLADDIRCMPMGMHTVVSQGGSTLSGGQRQRLMIARALVKKPRLIFFDEATSALDNRTQAIVSTSLKRLRATRIVVAHRLSTIRHADRIHVIERGRIVESGQYDELMLGDGLFAMLAHRQMA